MADGASYMVGLGGEPIYCQEIESSQRKSVDPPSSDELRRKHRGGRSSNSNTRTRYNLEPLEENSCESTKSRASTKCSLELNPNRKVLKRYDSDADTEYPLPKKKQVEESAKKKKQQQLDPPDNRKDRLSERRKKQGGANPAVIARQSRAVK